MAEGHSPSKPAHRALVPTHVPPADRPHAESQPCAACGALLDPLRAAQVLIFDDGFRYVCDASCATQHRKGGRHEHRTRTRSGSHPALAASTPESAQTGRRRALELGAPTPGAPWLGIAAVAAAMLLGLFAPVPAMVMASTLCTMGAACTALWRSLPSVRDVGWIGWLIGPVGALGAALAAYEAVGAGRGGWLSLQGAALAAAAMVARAWLDAEARGPVDAATRRLGVKLPRTVSVPITSEHDSLKMALDEVDIERVRTGEEVIVGRGQTVPVDGVIQAGEARVLPFPGAPATLKRGVGDPLLAGAFVDDGAVRVLATRVGAQRALLRIAQFGAALVADRAPSARLMDVVGTWGAPGVLLLAIGVLLLADPGLGGPLAAASSVLLAAPLLAARRAVDAPLVAAAASGAARGILFQSPAAIEAVGGVSVVAMSPHGTLTEGRPEVVECHVVGEGPIEPLLSLCAAAERATTNHRIGRAINRYARTNRIAESDVRRPVYLPGRGVTALNSEGQEIIIGNRRLLLDEGVSVAAAETAASRAEASGRTPVLVSLDGRLRAVIALHDELRVGARAAIQRLYDLGLEVVLLTGDQRGAVERLAAGLELGHIKAELLPDERGREVRSLREAGGKVAAIGRPGEDDAALAAADVGIVLGAAGGPASDRAVALVGDDLRDAAAALWIAHTARETTRRAMRLAVALYALLIGAAATGLLVPAVAAAAATLIDALGIGAGARLLRRIALRLPARS